MEESYKDKVFNLVYNYHTNLKWERDEKSNYSDYECEVGGLKLRLVSNREGDYLQVLRTCTNYRCYDAEDYPKVKEMLDNAYKKWMAKRDEQFFLEVYNKLGTAFANDEYNKM